MDEARSRSTGALTLSLDLVSAFRPAKVFNEYVQPDCHVTSADYDDRGELLVTASNDETIQLYNCRTGRKKYGVHLARFTHRASAIIYASTKEDEMSPVDDTFLSGAVDDAVRFWDLRSPEAQGHMRVRGHPVVGYDPTGAVFAVALNERNTVLLYDVRKFDCDPFLTITLDDTAGLSQISMPPRVPVITSLSFNQSGQFILVGTAGDVHYILDSFAGKLLWRLVGHVGLEQAPGHGVGMAPQAGISGQEVCWTPDGRMVLSGSANGQLCIWALPEATPEAPTSLRPSALLNGHEGPSRVVEFNPKCARTSNTYLHQNSLLLVHK